MMRLAKKRRILSVAFAAALWLATAPAFAACSTPLGNAGDVVYSSISNTMAYCNGTFWIAMGSNSNVSYGTLTTNDFCVATSGTAISCATVPTGTGNVVLSSSPTLTGTVAGANSTWTGQVAIGTTALSGAMNVSGTVTATTFSGSGSGLTSIGTASLSGVVAVANGGTAASSQTNNGVAYYNGTALTTGTGFVYSGGNVGIGTTGPATTFDVNGDVRVIGASTPTAGVGVETSYSSGLGIGYIIAYDRTGSAVKALHLGGDGGTGIHIGASGNVGIGTTAPYTTLHLLNSGSATQLTIGNPATGHSFGTITTSADTGGYFSIQGVSNQGTSYGALVLDGSGGNVAIGTTTTSGALNVAGTVTATAFSGAHSGSGSGLTGIGTASLGGITGTPSGSTFLSGAGTWGTVSGAPNTVIEPKCFSTTSSNSQASPSCTPPSCPSGWTDLGITNAVPTADTNWNQGYESRFCVQ
jgi:hypothetical protein